MLHVGALSLSVCLLCVVMAGLTFTHLWLHAQQVCSLTQPHESNPSDSGQARLLKPAVIHTHTQNQEHQGKPLFNMIYVYYKVECVISNFNDNCDWNDSDEDEDDPQDINVEPVNDN
ncbi:unnamed protein product [Arctogadus glacialis]